MRIFFLPFFPFNFLLAFYFALGEKIKKCERERDRREMVSISSAALESPHRVNVKQTQNGDSSVMHMNHLIVKSNAFTLVRSGALTCTVYTLN